MPVRLAALFHIRKNPTEAAKRERERFVKVFNLTLLICEFDVGS